MAKQNKVDMTQGSLLRGMIAFTIPIILTNLLQTLYNAADIIVVGNFAGKEALGAVGSTGSITNLIVALFINLSVGTSVIMARNFGAKDQKEAFKTLHTSIAVSILLGVAMLIVGVFIAKPALMLMSTPSEILDGATLYMQITFLGMPAQLFFNFGAAALRATGDTKGPLKFLTLSGILNVVLNIILVVFFHMDVAGVAIATIAAQYMSAIMVFLSLRKASGYCHLDIGALKIDKKILLEMLKLGVPAGIQSIVFSFSNVLIQSAINSFNSVSVSAGSSVASNLENFVYVAQNSLMTTSLTAVSQHIGAKKVEGINKSLIYSLIMVTVVGIGVMGIIYINPRWFLSLYNPDPAVIDVALVKMAYVCIPYFICGIMEVLVGALRGMGTSFLPMIGSIGGVCGIRIIWILTVFQHYHTLEMLYIAYPISWLVTLIFHSICLVVYKKRVVRKLLAE